MQFFNKRMHDGYKGTNNKATQLPENLLQKKTKTKIRQKPVQVSCFTKRWITDKGQFRRHIVNNYYLIPLFLKVKTNWALYYNYINHVKICGIYLTKIASETHVRMADVTHTSILPLQFINLKRKTKICGQH